MESLSQCPENPSLSLRACLLLKRPQWSPPLRATGNGVESHQCLRAPADSSISGGIRIHGGFPGGSAGKESACNVGGIRNASLIPESGRSPKGGHGNPPQHPGLEKPMDRGS